MSDVIAISQPVIAAASQIMTGKPVNPSGIVPIDLRVLVLPDAPGTKIGSIIIPETEVEKRKFAQTKGTLIAVGENAWEEAAGRSAAFIKPAPGDRVIIGKYAGIEIKGTDGVEYRLMNDEDVTARLEE